MFLGVNVTDETRSFEGAVFGKWSSCVRGRARVDKERIRMRAYRSQGQIQMSKVYVQE